MEKKITFDLEELLEQISMALLELRRGAAVNDALGRALFDYDFDSSHSYIARTIKDSFESSQSLHCVAHGLFTESSNRLQALLDKLESLAEQEAPPPPQPLPPTGEELTVGE